MYFTPLNICIHFASYVGWSGAQLPTPPRHFGVVLSSLPDQHSDDMLVKVDPIRVTA